MTIEWLEEQYSKALDKIDELNSDLNQLSAEVEQLKDVICDLLPATEDSECIWCKSGETTQSCAAESKMHIDGSLCFWHPYYDRARKTLGIEREGRK